MPSIFHQINQGLAPGMQGWTGAPSPAQMAGMQGATPIRDIGPPGKPGGPPQQFKPGKPGGPPQPGGGSYGGMGPQFGARNMFMGPPQAGFPPPTGKPGLPPVNPSALNDMRPQIGPGIIPPNPQSFTAANQSAGVDLSPQGIAASRGFSIGPGGRGRALAPNRLY